MEGHRAARIIEALREELDELIGYEMSDPRVEGVTVSEVVLSPDGKKSVIRISVPGGNADSQKAAVEALDHARNFIKRELVERLQLFRVPELKFEADLQAGVGNKLDVIMRRIKRGRPRDGGGSSGGEQQVS
jgi:ribosome-binding factor A